MAEALLFHHAQCQTAGCPAFADALRAAGHTVHAPDLYEGRTFATVDGAELFLYPGDRHLFTDKSLAAYDEAAATLVRERVLAFVAAA